MTPITADRLSRDIDEFLAFKRSLGFKYGRGEFILRSFERFTRLHANRRQRTCLDDMLAQWLARIDGRAPVTVALDLGVVRQLCLHKRRHDPHCFVPDRSWAPQTAKTKFLPHIFSRLEVRQILRAALDYDGRNLSGRTLHTFILVLYCTGLRPGEGARLQVADVNLDTDTFTIKESKGKSRLVPFRDDLGRELAAYRAERESLAGRHNSFWTRRDGRPISEQVTSCAIRRLFRQLGLKPSHGRIGPRPYDFRHTFAVGRLTQWYKQGVDIQAHLPWLSAYMGHDNVLGTEVYLNATPELLAIASDRFSRRVRLGNASQ